MLIIEDDSAIIIHIFQRIIHGTPPEKTTRSWNLLALLEELPTLLVGIRVALTSHVKRDANKVADYLANHNVNNPTTHLNATWNSLISNIVHNKCTTLSLQDNTTLPDGVTSG